MGRGANALLSEILDRLDDHLLVLIGREVPHDLLGFRSLFLGLGVGFFVANLLIVPQPEEGEANRGLPAGDPLKFAGCRAERLHACLRRLIGNAVDAFIEAILRGEIGAGDSRQQAHRRAHRVPLNAIFPDG